MGLSQNKVCLLEEEHVIVQSLVADAKYLRSFKWRKFYDFALFIFYSVFELLSCKHNLDDVFNVSLLFSFAFSFIDVFIVLIVAFLLALKLCLFQSSLILVLEFHLDLKST